MNCPFCDSETAGMPQLVMHVLSAHRYKLDTVMMDLGLLVETYSEPEVVANGEGR